MALLFVTLPFVVRSVQPVLAELDREMEEAGASLGASTPTVIRRIVLPNLVPAILTGSALAFARCIGEFGSVVLIAGNIPYRTELASVYIFGQVEADDPGAAAAVSVRAAGRLARAAHGLRPAAPAHLAPRGARRMTADEPGGGRLGSRTWATTGPAPASRAWACGAVALRLPAPHPGTAGR